LDSARSYVPSGRGDSARRCTPGKHTEHLVHKIGGGQRSGTGGVIGRGDLDEVASNDVKASAPADDLERLWCGEPADFWRARARCVGRVEAIDIHADVHRPGAELCTDLNHQRGERSVPALFGLHHAKALTTRPIKVVGRVSRCAYSDLGHSRTIEQSFVDRTSKRRAMGDRFAEHRVVDVGMGIDVHQADRAVYLGDSSQHRQDHGVVAAETYRDHPVGQEFAVVLLDTSN
jgi:hypothetical protein